MNQSALTRALGYRKFRPGTRPRLLVLQADYYVYADLLQAARGLGWKVEVLEVATEGQSNSDFLGQLLTTLAAFKPDCLFTINHLGFDEQGVLAAVLSDLQVPLVSWFVDHPMPILGGAEGNARDNCQVFCFEETALPWLEQAGFVDPAYLPTASNTARFHPRAIVGSKAARLGRPLALVAGSWWKKARASFSTEARKAAKVLSALSQGGTTNLVESLTRELSRCGRGQERAWYDGAQVCLAQASMERRQVLVKALLPLQPSVFGDEAWRELVPGVSLEPAVDPVSELPALFAGSTINLNVTAAQMPTAVNQRVWDVPAAGSFLLTDAQQDIFKHFDEGREMVTYASLDEACDKAEFYTVNSDERERIAARAGLRVEREHQYEHRLLKIEEVLRSRFGPVTSSGSGTQRGGQSQGDQADL
jgi:spore maturation protein CgeB